MEKKKRIISTKTLTHQKNLRVSTLKEMADLCNKLVLVVNKMAAEAGIQAPRVTSGAVKAFAGDPAHIKKIIERYFNVDISAKTQKREVAVARQAFSYMIRKYTTATYEDIAAMCGLSDHGNARKQNMDARNKINTDAKFRHRIVLVETAIEELIKKELQNETHHILKAI